MVKTPEQYFQEQDFDLPSSSAQKNLTSAEQAFLHKYVGVEGAKAIGVHILDQQPDNTKVMSEPPLEETLKKATLVQMIFFYVQGQLYTIPIDAVQEVIKFISPSSLPLAPDYVAGIINLRGRVTPLLYLEQLVCLKTKPDNENGFIIVCNRRGLQVGLIVDRIHNMYTIKQEEIIWNVESQIGANADFLCGILDYNDKIFGIVSIDSIVDQVIQARDEI